MECSFAKQDFPSMVERTKSKKILLLPLNACKLDLTTHLITLGISSKRGWQSSSTVIGEKDLILSRAGHFHLSDEKIASMTICPKHRQELTVNWPERQRMTCGYPTHKGERKQMRNSRQANVSIS